MNGAGTECFCLMSRQLSWCPRTKHRRPLSCPKPVLLCYIKMVSETKERSNRRFVGRKLTETFIKTFVGVGKGNKTIP